MASIRDILGVSQKEECKLGTAELYTLIIIHASGTGLSYLPFSYDLVEKRHHGAMDLPLVQKDGART